MTLPAPNVGEHCPATEDYGGAPETVRNQFRIGSATLSGPAPGAIHPRAENLRPPKVRCLWWSARHIRLDVGLAFTSGIRAGPQPARTTYRGNTGSVLSTVGLLERSASSTLGVMDAPPSVTRTVAPFCPMSVDGCWGLQAIADSGGRSLRAQLGMGSGFVAPVRWKRS